MKYTPKSWTAVEYSLIGLRGYKKRYIEANGVLVANGIDNPNDAAIIAVAPDGYELALLVVRTVGEFSPAALLAAEEILTKVEEEFKGG